MTPHVYFIYSVVFFAVSLESTIAAMNFSGFLLVAVPQWAKDETTQIGHFQVGAVLSLLDTYINIPI